MIAAASPRGRNRPRVTVIGALFLLTGALVVVPACAAGSASPGTSASVPRGAPGASSTTGVVSSCTTHAKIEAWGRRRLAMETLAVPAYETDVSAVKSEVSAGAGGVLLFGASAPTNLGSRLASLESDVPGRIGLLVMTDEEGGGVQRMANLVGSLPWAAWMGSHWTAAQIRSHVAAVGARMLAHRVNMDLAPVVDVDGTKAPPSASDPDGYRSFSGSTSVVTRDGVAFMRGLESSGVIPVLKHFPGLGGASGNTDYGPAHTLPWAELKKVAIPPYVKAIADGAPAIMVANATVPGLASYPASLSPAAIGRELKGTLGFHGLVMTDSLSAKAISAAGFSLTRAAVQALRAGADMLLFDGSPSQAFAIRSAVAAAVVNHTLPRQRLVAAAAAVLAARHVNLCR